MREKGEYFLPMETGLPIKAIWGHKKIFIFARNFDIMK